jgi:hypothetical protein
MPVIGKLFAAMIYAWVAKRPMPPPTTRHRHSTRSAAECGIPRASKSSTCMLHLLAGSHRHSQAHLVPIISGGCASLSQRHGERPMPLPTTRHRHSTRSAAECGIPRASKSSTCMLHLLAGSQRQVKALATLR